MRWTIAVGWVALQVLFFGAWAGLEQFRLAKGQGTSILVKVVPVDPRDLLRGQYFALGFDFSRPRALEGTGAEAVEGSEVWYVLKPEGEFHVARTLHGRRPERLAPGEVALRGRRERWRILYGIEEYYVPEGTPTPDMSTMTVRLRIGADGGPRIEEVHVKGQKWP